jgi:LysM repeat protein
VAEKAGKAAPAVAIAGALVAAPQAQHAAAATAKPDATAAAGVHKPSAGSNAQPQQGATAALEAFRTHTITVATASRARHAAAKNTHYKVRSGDTLSGIAERYYHRANDWQWLYHENATTVSNPDLIYPGQSLLIPAHVPANYTLTGYVPRHARPSAPSAPSAHTNPPHTTSSADTDHDGASGGTTRSAGAGGSGGSGSHRSHHSFAGWGSNGGGSGTLGCSGLERLWEAAGGSPAHAFIAAEIAMAESGGNQYAHSPTNDFGYWQINASNGALATYNAFGNARSAIILSQNGTNWSPWTTYTSGAYAGRC